MSSVSAMPESVETAGRSSGAPKEQLGPTVSGRAWRIAAQKASTEWPERLRPDMSVSVIEIISGTSVPRASPASMAARTPAFALSVRSEEHTSELQSLMRNSYAVFCLKTKHIPQNSTNNHNYTHHLTNSTTHTTD